MRKTSGEPKLRDNSIKHLPVCLKTNKVMENRKRLKNCLKSCLRRYDD